MRIKKVINNNILCAVDEKGNEMIVTGKGLGFKRKIGEHIDPALVEKTYHMEGKAEQRKLRELFEEIPLEHLKLTQDLIDFIKTQVASKEWNSAIPFRGQLCVIILRNTVWGNTA